MVQLDPEDAIEVERVAREYTEAFRTADADKALALTVFPVADCVDLGEVSAVFLMDKEQFVHSVLEHANEEHTTETTAVTIEPLGHNAALARVDARLRKPDGSEGEVEWVEFLARTTDGWRVWANWLGPLPAGF